MGRSRWKIKINVRSHFTRHQLNYLLVLLWTNVFFSFGNSFLAQVIDISMGSDPAPSMASLFPYYYENKWLLSTKKNNLVKAINGSI